MDFYVYTYLREDGSPYYVGKGTGRRAYTISKNHYPPKDLTGKVFGLIYVLQRDGYIKDEIAWLCKCTCGNRRRVVYPPKFASTKKCGCHRPGVVLCP